MRILFVIVFFIVTNFSLAQNPCIDAGTDNCWQTGLGSEYIMTTPGNVDFVFDEMREYISGITLSGKTVLRLKIDEKNIGLCKWKLIMYIDNIPHPTANEWYPLITYSSNGITPELNLIKVNVYNTCGTPINSGTFQIFDGNVQYDLIPIIDFAGRNLPGDCDGDQVNGPGSYLINYNEFTFTVDYYIKPGYLFQSGAYQIIIRFCLVED